MPLINSLQKQMNKKCLRNIDNISNSEKIEIHKLAATYEVPKGKYYLCYYIQIEVILLH